MTTFLLCYCKRCFKIPISSDFLLFSNWCSLKWLEIVIMYFPGSLFPKRLTVSIIPGKSSRMSVAQCFLNRVKSIKLWLAHRWLRTFSTKKPLTWDSAIHWWNLFHWSSQQTRSTKVYCQHICFSISISSVARRDYFRNHFCQHICF